MSSSPTAISNTPDANDDDLSALERSRTHIAAIADVIVEADGAPLRATAS